MKKDTQGPKVLYISGAGRSGSTLFDIILGNHPDGFSLGELIFLAPNGIVNQEYCSCGQIVPKCPFWSKVIAEWEKKRSLELDQYIKIQKRFLRNKRVFHLLWNCLIPSEDFKRYLGDITLLYEILFKHSNQQYLIDSSKAPSKILVLKQIGIKVEVIHLRRNFSGVLNSSKKSFEKNLKEGVERVIRPQKTFYATTIYMLDNIFTYLFSFGLVRHKVRYEDLTTNLLEEVQRLLPVTTNYKKQLIDHGPFLSDHLVAGNKMRMNREIMVAKRPLNDNLSNLKPIELFMTRLIDSFF